MSGNNGYTVPSLSRGYLFSIVPAVTLENWHLKCVSTLLEKILPFLG